MEIYNDSFSLKKPFGRIKEHLKGWTYGEVVTPNGIVSVYAQANNFYLTRLDFVFKNRLYIRSFKRRYSHRGIITKANLFTKEIVGK